MADKTRKCPQCSGTMHLRLGEFQCDQCGHSMAPGAEEPQQSGHSGPAYGVPRSGSEAAPGTYSSIGSSLGPAVNKQPLPGNAPVHDPGAQYRAKSTGTETGTTAPGKGMPGNAPADMYASTERVRSSDDGSLNTEKMIYFGVTCAWVALTMISGFSGYSAAQAISPMAGGFAMLVGGLITLGLYYWVLFGEEVWGKWTCLGCTGFALLSAFGTMFTGASALQALPQLQSVSAQAIQSFLLVVGIIQVLWSGWLLSILWRDVQRG
ncbi:MAG: hypothetical protein M3R04_03520 [bacterium]|nr:hypothetical protein [bacterium]